MGISKDTNFEKKLENLVNEFNEKFEKIMDKRKNIVKNFIKEINKKKEKLKNKK